MANLRGNRKVRTKAKMTRTQAVVTLISRAVIYAKAGDSIKAGKALLKAAEVDEELLDNIAEDVVDTYDEEEGVTAKTKAKKVSRRVPSKAAVEEEDDIEILEEGEAEEDEEFLEDEELLSSFGDTGAEAEPDVDGEGSPLELDEMGETFDTAPAVRNVEVPASVARAAARLKSTQY